jgi:hypothetical protein
MPQNRSVWLKDVSATLDDLKNYRPNAKRITTVHHIIEGRNAWHSTWVGTYNKMRFCFEFAALLENAEKRRVQGSVFNIEATPLILTRDNGRMVGTTVVNERNSKNYDEMIKSILSVKSYIPLLSSDLNWLISFYVPSDVKLRVGYNPKNMKSYSQGSAYRLGWTDVRYRKYEHFLQFYKHLPIFT